VSDIRVFLAVALGGGLGSMLRLFVTQAVVVRIGAGYGQYATMFINVSGSFLIGVVLELAQTRANVDPIWRFFFATGILGGYTTFSTFSFEAFSIASGGLLWTSIGYVVGSVVLGIAGAICGVLSARMLSAT
jgi:CrcB protein